MSLPDVPKIERQNSPELKSNQSVTNNGVPPMVVYMQAAFILLLFFVMFSSQREVGQLASRVETLQNQVNRYDKDLRIKVLVENQSREDELRAEIAQLNVQLKGKSQ